MSDDTTQPDDRTDRLIAHHLSKGLQFLVEGDRTHAVSHFADAIVADPARPEAYEHLAALAPTVAEYDALCEGGLDKYTGALAGRAALSARAGDLNEALRGIVTCACADPATRWTGAPWWRQLRELTDPHGAARILRSLTSDLPVAEMRPFLDLARDLAVRHPDDADLAADLCLVADKLGAPDEGDRWCLRAILSPARREAMTSLRIWRRMRKRPAMEAAWIERIEADPDHLDAQVNLATGMLFNDRRDLAEQWIERVLARDPANTGARSLRRALAYRDSGDPQHLVAIVDETVTDQHLSDAVDAILTIVCDTKTWLNRVPMPTEVAAMMMNQFAKQRAEGTEVIIARHVSTAAEPPSAEAAVRRLSPGVAVQVLAFPEPDLRVPVAHGTYRVWRYNGTTAVAVKPAPSDEIVAMFRDVANLPWRHPADAYRHAAALDRLSLDDLLSLLGHMPPSPDNTRWANMNVATITYWPRLGAVWACLGILHHRPEEPWPTSTRRSVLIDLVNGIEDWTTDSALFALVVAAWINPEARDDVRTIVRARLDVAMRTRKRRLMTIAPSIAALMLITPGCTRRDRAVSRKLTALTEKKVKLSRADQAAIVQLARSVKDSIS